VTLEVILHIPVWILAYAIKSSTNMTVWILIMFCSCYVHPISWKCTDQNVLYFSLTSRPHIGQLSGSED